MLFRSIVLALASLQYWLYMGLVVVALLVGWYWRYLMLRRLQGWTGDTAGASIELTEGVLLFAIVVLFAI